MLIPSRRQAHSLLSQGWAVPIARRCDLNMDQLIRWVGADDTPHTVLFESGRQHPVTGRYSFAAKHPRAILRARGQAGTLVRRDQSLEEVQDPLEVMEAWLRDARVAPQEHWPPFTGGWLGYFGYDLRHHFERLPRRAVDDLALPDLYLLFIDTLVAYDHATGCGWLIALATPDQPPAAAIESAVTRLEALGEAVATATRRVVPPLEAGPLEPDMEPAQFEAMVQRAQAAIRDGEIYQANLSQRFSCSVEGSPWAFYERLRRINPSPFACFLALEGLTVASASPERLLRVRGRTVETRPIAGTRPRGISPGDELANAVELILNEKERAEHLMLVDLERNDLGRVCCPGSVVVDELMVLETYSHVIHIVSNVRGLLAPATGPRQLLRAVFPGGTVTGVPKVRCMELIDAIEPVARNLYTGSIGYVGCNGSVDLNIAIRTCVITGGRAYIQVGAGIVADSRPSAEYAETLHKAEALFQSFTSHGTERPRLPVEALVPA